MLYKTRVGTIRGPRLRDADFDEKTQATIGCDVSINNQQSTIEIAFAAGHDE